MNIKLSKKLLSTEDIDTRWNYGPFVNLKNLLPKQKGKRFEQIAKEVFTAKGMTVNKSDSTDYDLFVDDVAVELKGSMITKEKDDWFSFLQIRPDQDYQALVLECFWFDGKISYYWIEKNDIEEYIKSGIFKKQHGGNKSDSGTFCYNGDMAPFIENHWFDVYIN